MLIKKFEGNSPKIDPKAFVAETAVVIGKAELKEGQLFTLHLVISWAMQAALPLLTKICIMMCTLAIVF